MKAIIDLTEVAEQLAKCQPGDEEQITIRVTSNDGQTLQGEATEVEHLTGGEEYPEDQGGTGSSYAGPTDEDGEPSAMGGGAVMTAKRRVPKAIMIVAKR